MDQTRTRRIEHSLERLRGRIRVERLGQALPLRVPPGFKVERLPLEEEFLVCSLDFYRGKLQAMQYFYRYELPNTATWAELLMRLDDTCYAMDKAWF
jgi:hypothetical protein